MRQPVRRRTWARRGQTPIHKSWDRRDRLSAICAISLSPTRRRLGLHFHLQSGNVHAEDVVSFVQALHRHLPRRFILVMGRWMVHRSAARQLLERYSHWLSVEWLPPYAPKLNPVEQSWNHTKYAELANFIPDDVEHLAEAVHGCVNNQRHDPQLLRSYFRFANLKL